MLHQSNFPDYSKSKPLSVYSNFSVNYLLDKKSIFWTPDYIDVSAWIEHLPFAFWIIEVLQPKVVVELGVHTGTSYFAFCQAVDRLNLETVCYGIDTWKGDEHAGFYGEEIFNKVAGYNASQYSKFSTLIRSTFDDAKNYFSDQSVDLLHIDGAHTYEAVKEDFDSWLPKLSPQAIVIFHDINVRERNFGVFRLWNDLKEQYRHFQFDFGFGLGVLVMDETDREEIDQLLDSKNSDPYNLFLKNFFFERGSFFRRNFEISAALSQANKAREVEKNEHIQLAEKYQALVEENRKQTEESKNSLLKSQALLSEVSRKLEETNANNQQLQAKIIKQNATLKWYRDTYEDRSLLGVLKEKLKSRSKKKITTFKGDNRLPQIIDDKIRPVELSIAGKPACFLNPAHNLIALPGTGNYKSVGNDPFFVAGIDNGAIRKGWYRLSIEIAETEGFLLHPRLYFDGGLGFTEENIWNLPAVVDNKIECLIHIPFKIIRLRFDPTTVGPSSFFVTKFCLTRMRRGSALKMAITSYRNIYYPGKKLTSFYAALITSFFKEGQTQIRKKLRESITLPNGKHSDNYTLWCALYDTLTAKQIKHIRSLSGDLAYQPLFSIVMPVYNAPINFLRLAIESVMKQAYLNWELCIADDNSTNKKVKKLLRKYELTDKRIKINYRMANGHISEASNSALQLAAGDFVVLLDQDDALPPHCLYMLAKTLNEKEDLEIIYSDEDKIDAYGSRFDPYFKSDWNKDLFYGQNLINHLGVYKHSLLKKIGGFRKGYEGSQDYDLALRCLEHLRSEQIHHIPHVLYHWRAIEGSTSLDMTNKSYAFEAGLKALKDHLIRTRLPAIAEGNIYNSYRVKWNTPQHQPLVSIIIPTKNKVSILSNCLESILKKTGYKNFEVLVIDNNSNEQDAVDYLKQVTDRYKKINIYSYVKEFNFSAIVNYGVDKSNGEIIVLLNNDTEVINEEWLDELVSQSMREEIGAVGAKLFYPNGQIQHAGVILYKDHPGNHIFLKRDKLDPGYFNKLNLVQNYSAVTAACMAVRKSLYLKVGGFDEANLKIAYNDVDFCLKLKAIGYKNLFTPFVQLIHHESISRGNDLDELNFPRFKKEHDYMLEKWGEAISMDPYYNPNLALDIQHISYAFPPGIKYEWQWNLNESSGKLLSS